MTNKVTIEQRKGRQLRKYEILDDEVKAEVKTDTTYQSYNVKFDEIDFNEIVTDRKPNPAEIGFFISVMFNLILVAILVTNWAEKMQIGTVAISSILTGIVSGMSVWAYVVMYNYPNESTDCRN
jgi:hypothetical protein